MSKQNDRGSIELTLKIKNVGGEEASASALCQVSDSIALRHLSMDALFMYFWEDVALDQLTRNMRIAAKQDE